MLLKVTHTDILRELGIDLLHRDRVVVPLLKTNPKIIYVDNPPEGNNSAKGGISMQYRAKFEVQ
jgi:hypothetical protein